MWTSYEEACACKQQLEINFSVPRDGNFPKQGDPQYGPRPLKVQYHILLVSAKTWGRARGGLRVLGGSAAVEFKKLGFSPYIKDRNQYVGVDIQHVWNKKKYWRNVGIMKENMEATTFCFLSSRGGSATDGPGPTWIS